MGVYGPDVLPATQPSVSKHWREHKVLTPISGLASSFFIYSRLLVLFLLLLWGVLLFTCHFAYTAICKLFYDSNCRKYRLYRKC